MLLIEVFRYLKRRADKRPVYLKNFVDESLHHGTRNSEPSVSIIIPTRDKVELLRACVESVFDKTIYKNFEIVVVDNGSREPKTLEYLAELESIGLKVLRYPQKFNYSAICNFAAGQINSEFLCFLNNDTEVIEATWLSNLVDHAIQNEIGVVGSKLIYPDGSIQHMGVALGHTGAAGHAYSRVSFGLESSNSILGSCFDVSAVTFACALVKKSTFERLGGLDESFKVGLNDIDYALRSKNKSLKSVVCGKSNLIHRESMSRKSTKSFTGALRAATEVIRFVRKWGSDLEDGYFRH